MPDAGIFKNIGNVTDNIWFIGVYIINNIGLFFGKPY
jgi:hypothetical protein